MNKKVIFPLISLFTLCASSFLSKEKPFSAYSISEETCSIASGTALNHSATGSWLGICVKDSNGEMIYTRTKDFYGHATDSGNANGEYIGPDAFVLNPSLDGKQHTIFQRSNYVYCSNTEAQSHPVYENCISLNISRFFKVGEIIKIAAGTKFPSSEYLKSKGTSGIVYTLDSDYYLLFESLQSCYFSVVENKEFAEDKYNKIHYLWDYKTPDNYRDGEKEEMAKTANEYLQSLFSSTSIEENSTIMINFNKAISAFKTDAELSEIEYQRGSLLDNINSTLEIDFDDYEMTIRNTLTNAVYKLKQELECSLDLNYIQNVLNKFKNAVKDITTKENPSFELCKLNYIALLESLLGNNKIINEIINKAISEINEAITESSILGAYVVAKNKLLNI